MKLYNIYNEVILEAVSNFKTWISGSANIARNIKDMLQNNAGGKYYYVSMTYPNDENIGGDSDRWVIITQYGKSKKDNFIIRVLEVNNTGGSESGKAKTYDINKIKKISISKVPVYSVPKEFEALYGDVANDTSAENPFKVIYATAKFGSYQYAASTLKQKERAAAKAAELEKQKGPQQQGTNEPVIEPEVTTTQQQTVEPQVPQQQNKPVVEPEVTTTQQQEPEVEEPEVEVPEVEKINKLLNNKIKK
jgi:hypothetical protein